MACHLAVTDTVMAALLPDGSLVPDDGAPCDGLQATTEPHTPGAAPRAQDRGTAIDPRRHAVPTAQMPLGILPLAGEAEVSIMNCRHPSSPP